MVNLKKHYSNTPQSYTGFKHFFPVKIIGETKQFQLGMSNYSINILLNDGNKKIGQKSQTKFEEKKREIKATLDFYASFAEIKHKSKK